MTRKRRGKNVRRQRRINKQHQIVELNEAPHSFIFARRGVGSYVKRLSLELRKIFEPFTASNLKVTKKNVIKDFINVAGLYNVTHLLYLTHDDPTKGENEDPSVGLHLIRSPHGPTIVFNVVDYCFMSDIQQITKKAFGVNQYSNPPLLAMQGFSEKDENNRQAPHLRLIVDMFQNMLPALNVHKQKLSNVKRVLLISRECDPGTNIDYISIRHYHIKTENRQLSKPLRRLGLGGSRIKKSSKKVGCEGLINPGLGPSGRGKSTGVPNLGKYSRVEDYLLKTGMLSDSGLSDFDSDVNEMELDDGVNKVSKDEKIEFSQNHGLKHITSNKAAIKLIELGPRLTLQLLKIEEGVNTGNVLYHAYQKRSEREIAEQQVEFQKKLDEKEARKAKDQENREENLKRKGSLASAGKTKKVCFNEETLDESKLAQGSDEETEEDESGDSDPEETSESEVHSSEEE